MAEMNREAKVSIILDINKALAKVDELQKKLNSLSMKNLESKGSVNAGTKASKAEKEISSYAEAIRKCKKELEELYYQNSKTFGSKQSEVDSKLRELEQLTKEHNRLAESIKSVTKAQTQQKRTSTSSGGGNTKNEKPEKQIKTLADATKEAQRIYEEAWWAGDSSADADLKNAQKYINALAQQREEEKKLVTERKQAEAKAKKDAEKQAKEQEKYDNRTFQQAYKQALDRWSTLERRMYATSEGSSDHIPATAENVKKLNDAWKEVETTLSNLRKVQQQVDAIDPAKATVTQAKTLRKEYNDLKSQYSTLLNSGQQLSDAEKDSWETRIKNAKLASDNYDKHIKQLTEPSNQQNNNNQQQKQQNIQLDTYRQSMNKADQALQRYMKSVSDIKGTDSSKWSDAERQQLEALTKTYEKAKKDYDEYNKSIKGKDTQTKQRTQNIKTELTYQQRLLNLDRQMAEMNYRLHNDDTLSIQDKQKLKAELNGLAQQYRKLNKESSEYRKLVGISSSRGFYDLGNNIDYFLAKFRGRITYSIASMAESAIMNTPNMMMDLFQKYQAQLVNFQQVMPDHLANNQELMNTAMKNFITLASQYGTSVDDVVEAGRLWGRQYKDVNIVQELVRNSTKLSITDNMSLTEVNKALEATMQQYEVRLRSVDEAQQVSGRIVDTWAKLADNAVVTAEDLAKANEQSAGAAYQAGVSFDYLQAMIATMSSATGKSGAEIGRSIRSMLVSMQSAKAKKFFDSLNIATTEMKDGVKVVRSYEKVIDELMQKLQKYPKDASKGLLAMSGGRQTCPLL